MKKLDLNRLLMWKTLTQVLNQYETVWTGNVQYSAAVEALKFAIESADKGMQAQVLPVPVATEKRESLAQIATDGVLCIAKCTSALARVTGNKELALTVQLSPYRLQRVKLGERLSILRSILQQAGARGDVLLPFGITAGDFAKAAEAVDAYAAELTAPRKAITARAAVARDLNTVMKDGHTAVRVLDDLLVLFEAAQPEFSNSYRTARVTVGTRGRKGGTDKPAKAA